MDAIFIVGLPVQLRARVEAVARQQKSFYSSVLTDIGKEGTFKLLPDPSDAVHKLRAYYDDFGTEYERACVLVLPYAPIPLDLTENLEILEELGGEVVYFEQGKDGWPSSQKKTRPSDVFYNGVFKRLKTELTGPQAQTASGYLLAIAERHSNIIILQGALDTCDQVTLLRHDFLKVAAEAFSEIIQQNGKVGRLDAFFETFGLEHAQTGGIFTSLTVIKDGKTVHEKKAAQTHLKRGDGTSPQGAARIYYQMFFVEEKCYIAILYAGPHPEDNIARTHQL